MLWFLLVGIRIRIENPKPDWKFRIRIGSATFPKTKWWKLKIFKFSPRSNQLVFFVIFWCEKGSFPYSGSRGGQTLVHGRIPLSGVRQILQHAQRSHDPQDQIPPDENVLMKSHAVSVLSLSVRSCVGCFDDHDARPSPGRKRKTLFRDIETPKTDKKQNLPFFVDAFSLSWMGTWEVSCEFLVLFVV